MQIKCRWQDGMRFVGNEGEHLVAMDAKKPFGADSEMSPCAIPGLSVTNLANFRLLSQFFFNIADSSRNGGLSNDHTELPSVRRQ